MDNDDYPTDWEGSIRALLDGKVDDATVQEVLAIAEETRWERYYDGMAAQREVDEYRRDAGA